MIILNNIFMNFHKISIKHKLQEGRDKLYELLNSTNWIDIPIVNEIDSKIMYIDHNLSQNIPIIYCKSIIACPPKDLFDYLVHNISDTCHEWNDLMYHSSVLHQFETDGDNVARISNIISNGFPASDREDVYLQICCKDKDSYYELSFGIDMDTIPLNISNKARNPNNLIRSDMHFAAKQITINMNGCEYTTIWHYDPMGWLSKFLPRKMLGNIILKNLVHEHEKLINKYSPNRDSQSKFMNTYSFLNSILTSFINNCLISSSLILITIYLFTPIITGIVNNLFPLTGISELLVSYIFYNNIFWSFILFLGCIVNPKLMIRINSVPWAFHPSYNMDVAYQTVLYIALHEKSINILSHLTIASDSIFWFIILLNIHNVVFPIFSIILLLQAYSIYKKSSSLPFVLILLFSWLTSIGIAYTIGNNIGWDVAQQMSIIFISISAFLRVITHSVEQIPPGVASILYINDKPKYDVFKKYKKTNLSIGKKSWLLMCFLQGYIAEFISSLPCRLFIVHVFYLTDMIGINIPSIGSWAKLTEHASSIRNNGWKASTYTSWMYEWLDGNMK